LNAEEAQFLNKERKANFNGLKVGQSAFFGQATFQGPVSFILAEIGGQLNANEAKFLNKKQTASFNSMKVGQCGFIDRATFQGPVDLAMSIFKGFSFTGLNYHSVKLEGMTYKDIRCGENWRNLLKFLKRSEPYYPRLITS
jgi:hypothetical protein